MTEAEQRQVIELLTSQRNAAMKAADAAVKAVVELVETLPARDQRVADAIVAALQAKGWLRETPAMRALVRRPIRDEQGRIQKVVERIEQVDPAEFADPHPPASAPATEG